MREKPASALTPFQVDVARAFFALAESSGFLLAGGAALAAQGLSARPTQDLDLFTSPHRGSVPGALAGLESEAARRGWSLERVRTSATFARVIVSGEAEDVLVDLALDATPQRPPLMSIAGPALDPEELAGRKLVALFDRAEARDFVDVQVLAQRFGKARLLELATAVDAGFSIDVLAQMLATLERFNDDEIPSSDPVSVRHFAAAWAAELRLACATEES